MGAVAGVRTGIISQRLLLFWPLRTRSNKILKTYLPPRSRLSDPERSTLAEIGKRLSRKALAEATYR